MARSCTPSNGPDDLEYRGKRVVVIGSGATAVTLLPTMAHEADHVTMLQRSPTYVGAAPSVDPIAKWARKLLPDRVAYRAIRAKNVALTALLYRRTRTNPDGVRDKLLGFVRDRLGDDLTAAHFTPEYSPWDQRLCLIPDGDLYDAINSGKASVVTDRIATFTETGIELASGGHLDADIIVTATGLNLVRLGEVDVEINGELLDVASTWTYKGFGYSGVPNLVSTFGFINASWTLRADMISDYVCRMLNHMTATGTDTATPQLRQSDADMVPRPFIDDFSAGYMQRSMHLMPMQGDRAPWLNTQDVFKDRKLIGKADVDDGVMQFTKARVLTPSAS